MGSVTLAPHRSRFVVMSRKSRSTMLSHEELVGVGCMWDRRCRSSQPFTLWCLCVACGSAITWVSRHWIQAAVHTRRALVRRVVKIPQGWIRRAGSGHTQWFGPLV